MKVKKNKSGVFSVIDIYPAKIPAKSKTQDILHQWEAKVKLGILSDCILGEACGVGQLLCEENSLVLRKGK